MANSKRGADPTLIRNINRSSVLEAIRELGPVSRTRLARSLGMSNPTVLRVVEQLLEENLIRLGKKQTQSSAGRPSILLEFNGTAHSAVAVSIGVRETTAMLVDLCGNVLHSELAHQYSGSGEAVFDSVVSAISHVLEKADLRTSQLRGIVVGIPGVVQNPGGRVLQAPGLDWADRDTSGELQRRFKTPVFFENDVNLNALGESGFGAARGCETSVSLIVGRGLGAGIILNGSLYHGTNYAAGEIGYMPGDSKTVGNEHGDIGRIFNLTIGEGLEYGLNQTIRSQSPPLDVETITPEALFERFQAGERWAITAVEEMSRYLAVAIANVSVLLDPGIVVIGGDVGAEYGHFLVDKALPLVRRQVPFVPPVVVSELGACATAMGAIMLIIHGTTNRVGVTHPRWNPGTVSEQ